MSSDHACSMELIAKAQRGEEQALEELLSMHQGLIRLLARRICHEQINIEELTQAGNIGFLYAIGHYDALQKTKLVTYAVPWILGEMRRALRLAENRTCSLDKSMDEDGMSLHDVLAGCDDVNIPHIDLRLALSRLCREEQMLICLRYYRDQTQKESALLLGKSQAQISRMERHALDALHAMLI